VEAAPEGSITSICIYFKPEFVYTVGQNSHDVEFLKPFYDHSVEFKNRIPAGEIDSRAIFIFIKEIFREIAEKKEFYHLAVKSHLNAILLHIIRYYSRFKPNLRGYANKRRDIERLKNVFYYLQNNFQEKISLETVSRIACMSSSYFCRFFKKVTGSNLTDYIFRLRIDHAKELLLDNHLSITEVAYQTGFESHSYFDRIFKRFTMCSPQDYRNRVT
jgi:AraC-like DNA-binding protein